MLQKKILLCSAMALLSSLGIEFCGFFKVLLNAIAPFESVPKLKLRKRIAILGCLSDSFQNIEFAHARIVLDAMDDRQFGPLRRVNTPVLPSVS